MTERKSFKRVVRSRMEKTGERYAAARAAVLAAQAPPPAPAPHTPPPAPAAQAPRRAAAPASVTTVSEDAIRRRTGSGWAAWFDRLDTWRAAERPHREIARWLVEEQGVDGWGAQAIAVSYERARGLRAVGQRPDGFSIGASRTVAVPVERLFDAVVDERQRARWLPDDDLRVRTASRAKSARFDWADGTTRVIAGFTPKGDGRSVVALAHERIPDAAEAERMKGFWRERLAALKALLES